MIWLWSVLSKRKQRLVMAASRTFQLIRSILRSVDGAPKFSANARHAYAPKESCIENAFRRRSKGERKNITIGIKPSLFKRLVNGGRTILCVYTETRKPSTQRLQSIGDYAITELQASKLE